MNLTSIFVSTGIVALAEIGDKTQLLSLVLAARFRRPWPIIWGILIATVANHAFAAAIGTWITHVLSQNALSLILGLSFVVMAVWTLIPDSIDESDSSPVRFGVFGATFIAFFMAEMGDKTQVVTIALAAQYNDLVAVVFGTTLGMMLANVPVVFLGDKLAHKLPVRLIHVIAALLFAVMGGLALMNAEIDWKALKSDGLRWIQNLQSLYDGL